jgi:hypothetical protein
MADISANYKRILAYSEGTYGTDAVEPILTTATADIVWQDVRQNFTIAPVRTVVEIDRARGSQSGVPHKTIADRAAITGDIPLSGWISGDAGEEMPYYAWALKACGMSETIVSATSATYRPSTAQQAGASIYLYTRNLDDNNWRLQYTTGVRGSANFQFALNQEAFFSFNGTGRYTEEISDAAAFIGASTGAAALLKNGSTAVTARSGGGTEAYANKSPIMCTNMTITVGGNTYCVSALNLDLNWTQDVKQCMGAAANVRNVYLTRAAAQRIAGSFDLLDGATAHDQVVDSFVSGAELAFSIVLTEGTGATGAARITISGSKLQIGAYSRGAEGGIQNLTVPFFLNGGWGDLTQDDDFSIVYDEVP